ncbi:dTDP-4-dehydrorhamnose reductase [Ruminococcaceae bacterium OttesenSCG-928-A16]|nr:dTDP-4-dehydrorhamnose reductase [Ruminococcaceae bacterium OttesenSCG-928-A16]
MKIMITGANGQLGTEIIRQLQTGGSALGPLPQRLHLATVIAVDLPDADLASRHDTAVLLRRHAPDVVINCAAFTNVDACETEPDTAYAANALAARNVAMACEEVGAKLVHISTDYVFSGNATTPLNETAPTGPQSIYGATKLLGEQYVKQFNSKWFIVRTSWLYGQFGNNFVKTIVRAAREKGSLKVVDDQFGNPTNAEDLAHHILKLAASKEYGLYHCTGNGICNWHAFAAEIVRLWGIEATVAPCTTQEFPRPAKRPAFSALDNAMLRATVGDEMRPWQEALADFYSKTKDNI